MHFNRLHQTGIALLEALIAMLLVAIIALGTAFALGKIMQIQRQSSAQAIAVNQLREKLQTGDCADKGSLTAPLNGVSECSPSTTSITMDDDISVPIPQLTVKDAALGGEMTVGGN
ncbi:prepilin-type cleavage/methylation domain-containing protein [Acinetobacter qingfengensis]|uniref:Uncharacterized protein n=1 Tax=Acinetobacter qingfengensis TaxID=1262585 RepID=A0A1E7R2Z1_9GAMM|nr:hypothetical protein [Acinetobacter qingfengensis]KAA8733781.1 prepilin-type cleavage/methylation domain-containing protein [Acinetobacter qingfengensis]OEY93708.1 hypothetical protein BJI46_04495 [Acinetobacter qingfengensis]